MESRLGWSQPALWLVSGVNEEVGSGSGTDVAGRADAVLVASRGCEGDVGVWEGTGCGLAEEEPWRGCWQAGSSININSNTGYLYAAETLPGICDGILCARLH